MKNKAIIFLRKNFIFVLIFGILLYLNIEKQGYHKHLEYVEKSSDVEDLSEEIESLQNRLDDAESYIYELQSVSSDNEDRIDENESDIEDIEYKLY